MGALGQLGHSPIGYEVWGLADSHALYRLHGRTVRQPWPDIL